MRNYLYIYNLAFLLIGNILFSNIHSLIEHDHSDIEHECVDCEYHQNNSNYICSDNELSILNNSFITLSLNDLVFIETKIDKNFHSRAPPIS